jgi:hypothetical protein
MAAHAGQHRQAAPPGSAYRVDAWREPAERLRCDSRRAPPLSGSIWAASVRDLPAPFRTHHPARSRGIDAASRTLIRGLSRPARSRLPHCPTQIWRPRRRGPHRVRQLGRAASRSRGVRPGRKPWASTIHASGQSDGAQPGRSSGRFAARSPCSMPVAWPTSMRYPSGSRM